MAKTRLTFQAVDKAVGWSATFFFLPAPHSRNCWRAHPLLRRPVEHPAPRRAALRLVATPQDTGLISFEQPPPLPIGFAPRDRLDLAPISALSGTIGRIATLAHYPLKAALLGQAQQRQASAIGSCRALTLGVADVMIAGIF